MLKPVVGQKKVRILHGLRLLMIPSRKGRSTEVFWSTLGLLLHKAGLFQHKDRWLLSEELPWQHSSKGLENSAHLQKASHIAGTQKNLPRVSECIKFYFWLLATHKGYSWSFSLVSVIMLNNKMELCISHPKAFLHCEFSSGGWGKPSAWRPSHIHCTYMAFLQCEFYDAEQVHVCG